jgi:hypothetical protein
MKRPREPFKGLAHPLVPAIRRNAMSIALHDQIQQLRAELTTHLDHADIERLQAELAQVEAAYAAECDDFEQSLARFADGA